MVVKKIKTIYLILFLFFSYKMDKLNDSEKQKIESLQKIIDKYQNDPDPCSELSLEQYIILAELQTIYNALTNTKLSNESSLYNNICKGVKDQMEQFTITYANMEAKELYENYMNIYQKAEPGLNKLAEL